MSTLYVRCRTGRAYSRAKIAFSPDWIVLETGDLSKEQLALITADISLEKRTTKPGSFLEKEADEAAKAEATNAAVAASAEADAKIADAPKPRSRS